MRMALISDTHTPGELRNLGELGAPLERFLSSVDLILHAGDIMGESVLDWLEQFAPVMAAQGNHDGLEHDARVEPTQFLEVEGWRIGMTHYIEESYPVERLRHRFYEGRELDVMIAGDSHYESLDYRDGVVIINSGSAVFPHNKNARLGTAGLLEVTRGQLWAEVFPLGHTEGRANPGSKMSLRLRDGRLVERDF